MYLEPKEEFKQIFDEGWRNQRDYLYVPNMHGADWPKMKEMYGALLPYVNHRADLNYLLDMMGAEIAIGHSYVRGGDMPEVPPSPGGLLGADFAIENGRYKITRIYDDESWNPDLRAPLAAPGVDVSRRRLHPRDQRRRAEGARQHLSSARRHGEPADGAHRERAAGDGRRAPGHGRAGRQRAGAAHARVGRGESPPRRQAVGRPARVRLSAEHRAAAATRASTATTSRSRTSRARSSTSATTAAARRPTTSSTCCSATSTATSTTSPAIACRSPARRPASGDRR